MLDRPHTKLLAIPTEMAAAFWPVVSDKIAAAFIAADQYMPVDIAQQLRDGHRTLWIITDELGENVVAAGMTAIYQMRSGKMCKILECGGEQARIWVHHRETIEAYAKAQGCDRVMIEGRPGWAKMIPDYKVVGVILEKRI